MSDDGGKAGVSVEESVYQKNLPAWTAWAVIWWAGISQVSDFLDPFLLLTMLGSFSGLTLMLHSFMVGHRTPQTVGVIATGTLFFSVTFGYCAWLQYEEVGRSVREIRQPCRELRAEIMRKADSNKSDAYEALHCRLFIDAWPFTY